MASKSVPLVLKVDLDLTPPQYQRKLMTQAGALLLLLMLVGGALGLVLRDQAEQVNLRVAELEAQEETRKSTVSRLISRERKAQDLNVEIEDLEKRLTVLQQVMGGASATGSSASAMFSLLFASVPQGVTMETLNQLGPEVTVKGRAVGYDRITQFSQALEGSGTFGRVRLTRVGEVNAPEAPSGKILEFLLTLEAKRE